MAQTWLNRALPFLLVLYEGAALASGTVIVHTDGGITHLQPPGNGFNSNQNATSSGLTAVTRSVTGSAQGFPFGGGLVSTGGTASGTAADGLLQAYSSSNVFVSPFPVAGAYNGANSFADTKVSWDDFLTVTSGVVPSHSALTVHASLLLSGSLVGAPDTDTAFRILGTGVGPGPNSFFTGTLPCSLGWCEALINGVAPAGQSSFSSVPVILHTFSNTATGLHFSLEVDSRVGVTVLYGAAATSAIATADFGHSLGWGGISGITIDGTGASLANYTLSSADGFDYSHAVVAVPEPESYAMLLAGFGILGLAARRSRRKSLSG
ncbi:MAG: PEP-CTERM sorting domain-containing protein [Caldimonas sp.]